MTAPADTKSGGIRIEDGMVVIRMPMEDAHSFRVALEPCPCKGPKTISNQDMRKRLSQGLAHALSKGK